jgi:GDPmannose 4,6-dehydratase
VSYVFEELGLNWREHVKSDASLYRPSDVDRSLGNPIKAAQKLGWVASKKFRDIIKELIIAEKTFG